jgi:hypothetical protein
VDKQHRFALSIQMVWSKNIHEERDAVHQIVLGSMDYRLCPLIAMGLYLAVHFMGTGDYATCDSLFAIGGGHNCSSGVSKESVRNRLMVCLGSPLFDNTDSQRKVGHTVSARLQLRTPAGAT